MITDTLDGILANPHPWIREYFHGPRARGAEMAERATLDLSAVEDGHG